MMKLIFILIPFVSFGQFTIERIAYDPAGTNDTLWTRDGSNKDTLFRRVDDVFVFGNKPLFRKFWTYTDVVDLPVIVTGINNSLSLKANQSTPIFTSALGYGTGAGGTVTQATNKSTGVTINKICGRITMNGAALAAAAEVSFTVTNSTVSSTDVVFVNVQSVGTAGAYFLSVGAVANGSFSVTVGNASAGSLSQAIVINFVVIKSVSN